MSKSFPLIGSTLIVAGTTIGAGMLALPLVSSGLGFPVLVVMLLACWLFMVFAAHMTLVANLAIEPGCTLYVMVKETLGRSGRMVCVLATAFLFYALMAAYIAAGGEQLSAYLTAWQPELFPGASVGMCLFAAIFGAITSIGARGVDTCNRVLFLFMLVAFAAALMLISVDIEVSYLATVPTQPLAAFAVLPVIFTSFGYHGSIPSLIAYLGVGKTQMLRVFIFGSLLPLLLYLLWLGVTLGQFDAGTLAELAENGSIPGLVEKLGIGVEGGYSQTALFVVPVFTNLALVTSFLGVGLGFFDFMHSAIGSRSRWLTAAVVFLPPLLVAMWVPDAFVTALSYGAVALAVLAILLPAAIVVQLKKQQKIPSWPAGLWFWPTVCFGVLVVLTGLL